MPMEPPLHAHGPPLHAHGPPPFMHMDPPFMPMDPPFMPMDPPQAEKKRLEWRREGGVCAWGVQASMLWGHLSGTTP